MTKRGAIIGFGLVASEGHSPAYQESKEIEIVAIVDPSDERRKLAQQKFPSAQTFTSVQELYSSSIALDFVDICTPPASHTALALGALAQGLHVLCEKPLCLSTQEYLSIAEAAAQANRTVFTVHNWKYAPIYQKAFEILRSNQIGQPFHVEIFTLRNSHCKGATQSQATTTAVAEDWRTNRAVAGGGILVDHGWHSFYLLMNLADADPDSALSRMTLADDSELEDSAQTLIQFPSVSGFIYLTWKATQRRNTVVIQGDRGTLLLDDDRILLTTTNGGKEEIIFESALSAGSHHAEWFKGLLPDFYEEMTIPSKRGMNLREAGWCVALTTASYESNMRGFKDVEVVFPGAKTLAPVAL